MLPGYILGRKGILNDAFLQRLTRLIVSFVFPCLAFSSVLKNFTLHLLLANWQLPVSSMLISCCGYAIGRLFLLFYTIKDKKERSSFLYCNTFNNYIFLPLAIVSQIFEPRFAAAVVISSIGTELLVWTLGVFIMQPDARILSRQSLGHLLSPPLVALYLAIGSLALLHYSGTTLNQFFQQVQVSKYVFNSINTLGTATVPLTLILAGARISQTDFGLIRNSRIWYGAIIRLLVVPMVAISLLRFIFPDNEFLGVLFIIAMTPVAFNSLVLGELFKADMQVISGTILLTYIASLITIPIWILLMF